MINYRKEIDALRGIAVLSVILYHSKLNLNGFEIFKGGFVGVDIFFVISGYLITKILIKNYFSDNFSFLDFYEKRARRLLPALYLILIVIFIINFLFNLPENDKQISKTIISVIFFFSNFYFYFSQNEYGAEDSFREPLLHTWSLSVEEQFYIFFPLFLLIILKFFNKYLNILFFFGFLLSLVLSTYFSFFNPNLSFYSFPTRAWELIVGCLIAINENRNKKFYLKNSILFFFGFILLISPIFFFDLSILHPSLITLFMPILGASIIICYKGKSYLYRKIFFNKYLIFTGIISYSLYLWHFLIFTIYRVYFSYKIHLIDTLIIIILSFLLSYLTFIFIEKKFRDQKFLNKRNFLFIIFGSFCFLSIISLSFYKDNNLYKERVPSYFLNLDNKIVCQKKFCFNKFGDKKNIILLGDSHLRGLEKYFYEYSKQNKYKLSIMNFGGCQYILNMERVNKISKKSWKCTSEFQNKRRSILLNEKKSTIIIGGRLPLIYNETKFDNEEGGFEGEMRDLLTEKNNFINNKEERQNLISINYKKSINELLEHGHEIILIYPIPEVGWNLPKKLLFNLRTNFIFKDPDKTKNFMESNNITTSFNVYKKRTKEVFEILDDLKHSNLKRVYPHKMFCNTVILDRCITHDKNSIFYKDAHHLSRFGNDKLFKKIIEIF